LQKEREQEEERRRRKRQEEEEEKRRKEDEEKEVGTLGKNGGEGSIESILPSPSFYTIDAIHKIKLEMRSSFPLCLSNEPDALIST
jgi:hypothetical protein